MLGPMSDSFFQPVSGFELPRFAGIPTFMRLPHVPPGHPRRAEVERARERATRCVERALAAGSRQVHGLRGQVRALSPLATMERGYAVVQAADGSVVRSRAEVTADELLRVRVADGDFAARVVGAAPEAAPDVV